MSKKKSNVKIENGKVILSDEVLSYFESWKTEENSEYIKRYKEVLLDSSNLEDNEFDIHHIIPAFIFADETHTTRNEMLSVADNIEGERIKLSHNNHILAHYFIWKIFPNEEKARRAIYMMLGKIKNFKNITENEIKLLNEIRSECKQTNLTEEEIKERDALYSRNYQKNNKEKVSATKKKYYHENRDDILKKKKIYGEENKDEISKKKKKHYLENKDDILRRERIRNYQLCFDPKEENVCTYNTLHGRKQRHKEKYKDVIVKDCIIPILP